MASDIEIAFGLFVFLLLAGFIAPFINAEFGLGEAEYDSSVVTNGISEDSATSAVSAFQVIGSMFTMFFWTFGQLPIIVDLILLTPVRLTLAFIIARNIWVGGGA